MDMESLQAPALPLNINSNIKAPEITLFMWWIYWRIFTAVHPRYFVANLLGENTPKYQYPSLPLRVSPKGYINGKSSVFLSEEPGPRCVSGNFLSPIRLY